MAYFIPTSIQKRLLRYALSRLELIDTDALELESLDIEWGRTSSVELRDVGLRKERIASILQLPAELQIEAARIALLRVTVPANIYTSSIVANISGVEALVELKDTIDSPNHSQKRPNRRRQGSRKASNIEETLPGPGDLARSFLEQEPLPERAQLEAEISTKSIDLQQSVTSSESTDDGLSYGTGTDLALPSFLAGFLKGVGDRLIVNVQDVSIKLKTLLEGPHAQSSTAVFQLCAGRADVKSIYDGTEDSGPEKQNLFVRKVGDRVILLEDVVISSQDLDFTTPSAESNNILLDSPDQSSPIHSGVHDRSAPNADSAIRHNTTTVAPNQCSSKNFIDSARFEDDLGASEDAELPSHLAASARSLPRTQSNSPPPFAMSDSLSNSLSSSMRDRFGKSFNMWGSNSDLKESADGSAASQGSTPTRSRLQVDTDIFSNEDDQSIYMSVASGSLTGDHSEIEEEREDPMEKNATYRRLETDLTYQPYAKEQQNEQLPRTQKESYKERQKTLSEETRSTFVKSGTIPDRSRQLETDTRNENPLAYPWSSNPSKKELLSIDSLHLHLPRISSKLDEDFDFHALSSRGPSTSESKLNSPPRQVPGAFSMYAESVASGIKPQPEISSKTTGILRQTHPQTEVTSHDPLELFIGTVTASIDVPGFQILSRLLKRIHYIFESKASQSPQNRSHNQVSEETDFETLLQPWKVQVNRTEVSLLLDASMVEGSDSPTSHRKKLSNVLSKIVVENFNWFMQDLSSLHKAQLELGRLYLRLGNDDLAWFSRDQILSASTRSTNDLHHKDLVVYFEKPYGILQTTVKTIPLHLSLDFFRLDEILESFGGFSGLLELGSSILSDAKSCADETSSPQRSRSVRFQSSMNRSYTDESANTPVKVNIKVGGAFIAIKSKTYSVNLRSSSVRTVVRSNILGIHIDDLRLSGPHDSMNDIQAASIRIQNLGLKYIAKPEEQDLDHLISLLTPSRDKFEEEDDFLASTLIKQRKKGTALRLNAKKVDLSVGDLKVLDALKDMITELAKLSAVTKYLPEETRPGMMSLVAVENAFVSVGNMPKVGRMELRAHSLELAHVGNPSLIAVAVGTLFVVNEPNHTIVRPVIYERSSKDPPMFMMRMIGDELEPTTRFKLWNTCLEYEVPLLMKLMDITEDDASGVMANLATSIANLPERPQSVKASTQSTNKTSKSTNADSTSTKVDVVLRDCAIGLNPRKLPSKGLLILTDTRFQNSPGAKDRYDVDIDIRKATLLLVDDVSTLSASIEQKPAQKVGFKSADNDLISALCEQGYVSVSWISAASVAVRSFMQGPEKNNLLDIEFKDELLVLETCADSTQTLSDLFTQLKPPLPPSTEKRYLTEIAPIQNMMESFANDAFAPPPPKIQDEDSPVEQEEFQDALNTDFDCLGEYADPEDDDEITRSEQSLFADEPHLMDVLAMDKSQEIEPPPISEKTEESEIITGELLPESMSRELDATATKWNSNNNRYVSVTKSELHKSPLKLRIRDMHIIWNLHDGYDWDKTRQAISKAVNEVESKAEEKRPGRHSSRSREEDDEESVIGDYLFNSIYIGVPVNKDPRELARQINKNLDEAASETTSHASTATTAKPGSAYRSSRSQGRKLRLKRSKRHKIAFELGGVSADIFVYPPGGETQNSVDVRIHDFEIFDHVPTSTWRKFATFMHDLGPREDKKPMVHVEVCDVRPVPELSATELVMRITVLPLRLHVDQDALDFMARFFDFRDPTNSPQATQPTSDAYLQRVEVRSVPILLDYKPKKVDYLGLRSGRTTEFMNFFILDSARITLKHTIVYGSSSFTSLHRSLEDVWMPDIRRNQLPSVLSGLNGIRTLVTVGSGLRDLVTIPVQEYKRDGRIVRSVSKGAMAFARTTGGELTRFGARLAVGAQTALQGAEGFLSGPASPTARRRSFAEDNDDEWASVGPSDAADPKPLTSPYAVQPANFLQGLRGAALALSKDLQVTRDAIIAVSGDMKEATNPGAAVKAVAGGAPTIVLRPMIGASKAVGWALMGATNTVDKEESRRISDKYKRG